MFSNLVIVKLVAFIACFRGVSAASCRSTGTKYCQVDATNCLSYVECSENGAPSEPKCCPTGTTVDEMSCTCVANPSCQQTRCLSENANGYNFGSYCIDENGMKLTGYYGNSTHPSKRYRMFDSRKNTWCKRHCPDGEFFSQSRCGCTKPMCQVYLPFDDDLRDHSGSNYYISEIGQVGISASVKARGSGSARFDKGSIEIPGFINDNNFFTSHCFFLRCLNPPCVFEKSGAYFSKRDLSPSGGSVVGSVQPGNQLRFEISCNSTTSQTIPVPIGGPQEDFIHLCGLFTGNKGAVYWNKVYMGTFEWPCNVPKNAVSLSIGYDREYGNLEGYLDEVLFCHHDIGAKGVQAHFEGAVAMRKLGLIA